MGNVLGADGGYIQTIEIMLDSNNDGARSTGHLHLLGEQPRCRKNSSFLTGFPVSGDLVTLAAGQGFDLGR